MEVFLGDSLTRLQLDIPDKKKFEETWGLKNNLLDDL